jgi:hypothetical protein
MKRITFRLYESNVTLLAGTDTSDFVMLSADPGESVRNFQTIVLVYQMGQLVFRAPK